MAESGTGANPISTLDLQDKLTTVGAIALAVLLFFPWFSWDMPKMPEGFGMNLGDASIKWTSAWQGKLSLAAAVLTALWMLIPGFRAAVAPKLGKGAVPLMPLILSGIAFVLGPLWFLMDDYGGGSAFGMSAGRTFWFWLALIAGLASAGGAAWKKFGPPLKT